MRADLHQRSHASRRAASSSTCRRQTRGRGANGLHGHLPLRIDRPRRGDHAVDEHGLRDVAVLADHLLADLVGDDPRPVGEAEDDVVPLRQEAHRRGHVARGSGARGTSNSSRPSYRAVGREAVERVLEVAHAQAGPVRDVGLRRRTERAEVAADDLGTRCRGVDLGRSCDALVDRRRLRRPARGLARVDEMRVAAHRVHHPPPVHLRRARDASRAGARRSPRA